MRIYVINEPFIEEFCRTQRWAARTRGRVLRAPDWLAYATAVLEKAGFDVELFDFPAKGWDKDVLRKKIRDGQPDFVVLDSTTPSIYSDLECAGIVKTESDASVIMVGPHASALPGETLEIGKGNVDVIAVGEYDYTIRDIITGWENLSDVPGIVYRSDDKTVVTEDRPLIENLDELPFPAWHHLDLLDYFDGGKLYPYVDIISGRGCPNRCIFCLWPQVMHGIRYRYRSAVNVVDEIEHDIELCPRVLKGGEFFFEDDTFTVNEQRAHEICDEILNRGLHIRFSVNARVDSGNEELFRKMKTAGCRELLVGFESANQQILDGVHKNLRVELFDEFMNHARNAKLDVHGCFVLGLPGETIETMEQTIQKSLSMGLHTVQFSAAVPFPGTRFFDYCEKQGLLTTRSWDRWLNDGEQGGVVNMPGLPFDVVEQYVDSGLKKFYFRPGYMLKFLFETKSRVDLYRKLRGAKNFLKYLVSSGK
jgi:radical SAM superfamily enzyme YgiQ (UPF0313 family)